MELPASPGNSQPDLTQLRIDHFEVQPLHAEVINEFLEWSSDLKPLFFLKVQMLYVMGKLHRAPETDSSS